MPIRPTSGFPPILLGAVTPPADIIAATALIVSIDGRYLFQLRDDKENLPLRNHWTLFGGHVEAGEDGRTAVLREVEEELSYKARECVWYHEAIYVLPRRTDRIVHKSYYLIQILPEEIDKMVLSEGYDMRLMTLHELMGLPRIAPWDLSVVLMHARAASLFSDE